MRITVNRQELLAAAQDAARIAPAASPLDVLKCALLSAEDGKLTVAATNIETALERKLTAQIEEEGSAVMNARLLCGMLSLMEDEAVSIAGEGCTLTVKGSTASYVMTIPDRANYPRMEIPFPADTVPVTGIPAMAKRTVFAVAEDDSKPMMKCVHLMFTSDGLRAVGSDSYRIAVAKGDSKSTGAVSFLIPATSLSALAQLVTNKDQLRVGTTGKTLVFIKENFLFSARLMEGRYFDADQLLSRVQGAFTVLTDAEKLRQTVMSVNAVSGRQTRFCLAFQGNILRVTYESEYGISVQELEVVPLSGTPCGRYWYTPGKLTECLKALAGTLMLEVAANGALLMRTDDLTCVQMPVREPGPIVIKQATETKPEKDTKKETKPAREKSGVKPKSDRKKKKEAAALPTAA